MSICQGIFAIHRKLSSDSKESDPEIPVNANVLICIVALQQPVCF